MSPSRRSGWRDEAASSLLAEHAPFLGVASPALVAGDPRAEAADAMAALDVQVVRWGRHASGRYAASAWPPPGPFATVALRLPLARDELEMTLHAVASVLSPGGRLLVYGARDEGIGSAAPRMEPLVGAVRVAATGARCRVLSATRPERVAGLKAELPLWRETFPLDVTGFAATWVSYPGVFAHGRLDEGTALLASSLDDPAPDTRALDFACGSGVLGALLLARQPRCTVEFLDVDALALEAVRENAPGARRILSDGWSGVVGERWDRIVSNPPIHAGKTETLSTLEAFVRAAPAHLTPAGQLDLVVQRRFPVQRWLEAAFATVRVTGDDGRLYRTWRARDAWHRQAAPSPLG